MWVIAQRSEQQLYSMDPAQNSLWILTTQPTLLDRLASLLCSLCYLKSNCDRFICCLGWVTNTISLRGISPKSYETVVVLMVFSIIFIKCKWWEDQINPFKLKLKLNWLDFVCRFKSLIQIGRQFNVNVN